MTYKKRIKGNKLIVRFMLENKKLVTPEESFDNFTIKELREDIPYFKYHKSWDWLIPVLLKLGKIFGEDIRLGNITALWELAIEKIKIYNTW